MKLEPGARLPAGLHHQGGGGDWVDLVSREYGIALGRLRELLEARRQEGCERWTVRLLALRQAGTSGPGVRKSELGCSSWSRGTPASTATRATRRTETRSGSVECSPPGAGPGPRDRRRRRDGWAADRGRTA
jgi:hypothetical protein